MSAVSSVISMLEEHTWKLTQIPADIADPPGLGNLTERNLLGSSMKLAGNRAASSL